MLISPVFVGPVTFGLIVGLFDHRYDKTILSPCLFSSEYQLIVLSVSSCRPLWLVVKTPFHAMSSPCKNGVLTLRRFHSGLYKRILIHMKRSLKNVATTRYPYISLSRIIEIFCKCMVDNWYHLN